MTYHNTLSFNEFKSKCGNYSCEMFDISQVYFTALVYLIDEVIVFTEALQVNIPLPLMYKMEVGSTFVNFEKTHSKVHFKNKSSGIF